MKWQKIANIAGPRGADGVDGETPDIEWQGTALSVNGAVGPDLRGPQGTPGDPGKDSTVPGPPGERGAPGPAPAIKIGTVSSGTTPSATITGTSPDLTLGLVLPKGDRGDRGETGPPGVVSSASSYVIVGPGRPDAPSTTGGVITGSEPVGAEYRSTDGANVGAYVWRKRPGGAWEVVDGDTGWRQVGTSTSGGGGSLTLAVRRIGSRAHYRMETRGTVSTGIYYFAPNTTGFKPGPDSDFEDVQMIAHSAGNAAPVVIGYAGVWNRGFYGANFTTQTSKVTRTTSSIFTPETWPTAPLPGSPA